MAHILVGNNLLLKVDDIVSANLAAKDDNDRPCIKIRLTTGEEWTIWANLEQSKKVLKSIPLLNSETNVIEQISTCVKKRGIGS